MRLLIAISGLASSFTSCTTGDHGPEKPRQAARLRHRCRSLHRVSWHRLGVYSDESAGPLGAKLPGPVHPAVGERTVGPVNALKNPQELSPFSYAAGFADFALITNAFIGSNPANLPTVTLTDQDPRIVAVDVFILAIDVMKGALPFSGYTYIVANSIYAIDLENVVVGLVLAEVMLCKLFCDSLTTAKCSVHIYLNRIVRVECAETT